MPFSDYLFAIFIFLLICALLYIYKRFIAQPKVKKFPVSEDETGEAAKEREERLFKLYQNIEEMMDNFEAYVEDTRDQMESLKRQMQQQSEGINEMLKRVEAAESGARSALAAMRAGDRPEPRREVTPNGNGGEASPAPAVSAAQESPKHSARHDAVRELLAKGLTVEQIAQKLELSINEVRLIVYGLMTKDKK